MNLDHFNKFMTIYPKIFEFDDLPIYENSLDLNPYLKDSSMNKGRNIEGISKECDMSFLMVNPLFSPNGVHP